MIKGGIMVPNSRDSKEHKVNSPNTVTTIISKNHGFNLEGKPMNLANTLKVNSKRRIMKKNIMKEDIKEEIWIEITINRTITKREEKISRMS